MKRFGITLIVSFAALDDRLSGFGSVTRPLVLLTFLATLSLRIFGQCPTSQFSAPSNVCLDEQVPLINNSQNASNYEWSFCTTDFHSVPSASKLLSNYGAVYYSKFIRKDGNLYLFFVSSTQNKLVGLQIEDPESLTYEVHCEIDLSGFITNPAGFDLINDNGTWTALIASITSPFKLVKITLDSNLETMSGVDDLSDVTALATPFDIKILKSEGNYFAFIANNTAPITQQLIRLSFGSGLSNAPVASYISFPSSAQTASLDFYHSCSAWTALISSRNGKIFRADFGHDLAAAPVITELALSHSLSDPAGLALVHQHDEFLLLLQSRNGNAYAGTLSSITDNTLDILDFGNIKATSRDWDFEVLPIDGGYKVVAGNFTNGGAGGLYALEFQTDCPVSLRSSTRASEIIFFGETGTFKISLSACNEEGETHSVTQEVTASSLHAPKLELSHPSVNCVSSPVSFAVSPEETLTSQSWDFGDGNQVVGSSPVHTFTNAGDYVVALNATSSNGCNNYEQSEITIYNEPSPTFSLPPPPLCTNNAIIFPTTTPDIYGGNLTYEWYVDNTLVGTDRDLQYSFTTTGPKDIKLVTAIPGCSSEITQTTAPLEAGPIVDFSFAGTCEDETFSFKSDITGDAEGYSWDFGDGEASTDPNGDHVFSDFGTYNVSLTVSNAAGCQNTASKAITVHAVPVADFSLSSLTACSGVPAELEDQSAAPDGDAITTWLWDFADPADPTVLHDQNPQHSFSEPGTYPVSLTASTAAGCTSSTIRDIDVNRSPSTDFTYTPACEDLPVVFTPPQDNTIDDWYWEVGTSYYSTASPSHTFKAAGDYPLLLEVTASNGCIASANKTIHVPPPLTPDFSYFKNCVGQQAVFEDVTTGDDPVVSREWTFDTGETFTGSPITFAFPKAENRTITLKVTAASGCSYPITKAIDILPAPVAQFQAAPDSGAYPLEVTFTNNSSGSSAYVWNFNDGTGASSTEASPVYTFQGQGSFDVELRAINEQQCESVFTGRVTTVAPLPDARIETITLSPNDDGSFKLIVTVDNNGNTILRELPLELDFSGILNLRQIMQEPILPGSKFNYVFSTGVVSAAIVRYLCVAADVENDLRPADNRVCKKLDDDLVVFQVFPNPVSGDLTLEWIGVSAAEARVTLTDALGKAVLDVALPSTEGLNRRMLDVSGMENGIYYLRVSQGDAVRMQKIAISAPR